MALKAQNKGGKSVMALLHSTGLNRSIVAGKVPTSLDTKMCMTGRITSRFHTSRPTNLKTLMTIFKQFGFETAELNDAVAKKKEPTVQTLQHVSHLLYNKNGTTPIG
jgi:hypothetical protein